MQNAYSQYLIPCVTCGESTSKKYARTHEGQCKACATGIPKLSEDDGKTSPDMYSHMGGFCRGDDLGLSNDF